MDREVVDLKLLKTLVNNNLALASLFVAVGRTATRKGRTAEADAARSKAMSVLLDVGTLSQELPASEREPIEQELALLRLEALR